MTEEYEIGWSNTAGKDLRRIRKWLTENASDAVADKVIRGIFNAIEPARTQPGRFPPEKRLLQYGDFRFILKWSYRIVYEFTGNQIIVHRIVHTKRDLKKVLRNVR